MQYEAKTPKEYLEKLEEDWRKTTLLEVRKMIKSNAPDLVEGIAYKMLSYGNGEQNVFSLNAQKNYVSFYIGNIDKVENGRELLSEFNLGKGCIRIKKSVKVSETKLNEFISRAINQWEKGDDLDC